MSDGPSSANPGPTCRCRSPEGTAASPRCGRRGPSRRGRRGGNGGRQCDIARSGKGAAPSQSEIVRAGTAAPLRSFFLARGDSRSASRPPLAAAYRTRIFAWPAPTATSRSRPARALVSSRTPEQHFCCAGDPGPSATRGEAAVALLRALLSASRAFRAGSRRGASPASRPGRWAGMTSFARSAPSGEPWWMRQRRPPLVRAAQAAPCGSSPEA